MVVGIFLIAVNPLEWFKKDKDTLAAQEQSEAFEGASDEVLTLKAQRQLPLNYAVLTLFSGGATADTKMVMEALQQRYGGSRTFKEKAVTEALMTGEANGLLEETSFEVDQADDLRVFYKATVDGRQMIDDYIKVN
jgi:hypothetical protein